MKNFLEIISQKLGLTKTELVTLTFVTTTFVLGLIIKNTKTEFLNVTEKKFNYNFEDSLFNALRNSKIYKSDSIKNIEKMVDYKPELLDFSKRKKDSKKNKNLILKQSRININTADIKALIKLPGIGKKTAEKIVELRKVKGHFKSLNELSEVKGIGKKKLKKMKDFIYLDK